MKADTLKLVREALRDALYAIPTDSPVTDTLNAALDALSAETAQPDAEELRKAEAPPLCADCGRTWDAFEHQVGTGEGHIYRYRMFEVLHPGEQALRSLTPKKEG